MGTVISMGKNADIESPLSELDRDAVWDWWGVDLQDMTRMPQTVEAAKECLWRWQGGEYIRAWGGKPAPGDLERLESIAAGHGDPTGKPVPDPLPDRPRGRAIDWTKKPVIKWPSFYRGFWRWPARRRWMRWKKEEWLMYGVSGYNGPRTWHRRIR